MINRGSEWRRWDLHLHTKGTNKNDCYTCADMASFCKLLFKKAVEKEICAIGITDYFSIARCKELKVCQDAINTNSEFTKMTHNPNLVVGADSKDVIVANQQGSNSENKDKVKFQYVNGSLENSPKKDDSFGIARHPRACV